MVGLVVVSVLSGTAEVLMLLASLLMMLLVMFGVVVVVLVAVLLVLVVVVVVVVLAAVVVVLVVVVALTSMLVSVTSVCLCQKNYALDVLNFRAFTPNPLIVVMCTLGMEDGLQFNVFLQINLQKCGRCTYILFKSLILRCYNKLQEDL